MKHTFFAFAATAMLMAPLAACGEDATYVPEDLESLGFPDDMEVIVWEPPQTSTSIDLSADKQLVEPDQAATSQDFIDGMNTRHDGPSSFVDAIDNRYNAPTAEDAPYGHQSVPKEDLRILDSNNRAFPEPSSHDNNDLPVLSTNDDGSYDVPNDMPQTGDSYSDSLSLEDPCLCQGQDCLRDWIDDNVGCDVCVAFMCGETTLGACAVCPADEILGQ